MRHCKGSVLSSSSVDVSGESGLRRPARPLSFAYEDVIAHPNGSSTLTRNGYVNNGSCAENDG